MCQGSGRKTSDAVRQKQVIEVISRYGNEYGSYLGRHRVLGLRSDDML
jgi:hypothetical protein